MSFLQYESFTENSRAPVDEGAAEWPDDVVVKGLLTNDPDSKSRFSYTGFFRCVSFVHLATTSPSASDNLLCVCTWAVFDQATD